MSYRWIEHWCLLILLYSKDQWDRDYSNFVIEDFCSAAQSAEPVRSAAISFQSKSTVAQSYPVLPLIFII